MSTALPFGVSRREVLEAIGSMAALTGVGTAPTRACTTPSVAAQNWAQEAKLAAADGDSVDRFGRVAVSEDGTTAIVGAYSDQDPNGAEAGSAYVFLRSGGEWTQQAKLTATDGDSKDLFGSSVTLSSDGTTAVVGSSLDGEPNGRIAGSAYVFSEYEGEWTQEAKLAAEDGDSRDFFGSSVAVSGDGTTAIIGTPGDEKPYKINVGSAYVFSTSGGSGPRRRS